MTNKVSRFVINSQFFKEINYAFLFNPNNASV